MSVIRTERGCSGPSSRTVSDRPVPDLDTAQVG
jgi:hypothetical protein